MPPDLLCIEASIFICRFPLGPSGEGHICALGHALHDDKAKQHLQRVLNIRFGKESIPDVTVWWYNTQLYLQDTRFEHKMSFQELYIVATVSLCTQGTTSTFSEVSPVTTIPKTWKNCWQLLNSSVIRDLSQCETWVANIWVHPHMKCCSL